MGYYRFSGYLYPYKQPDGTYREGTTLDEVWGRYTFDRQFRLVVLDGIERVEVWFRSQLAYEFSGRDGAFGLADAKGLPRLSAGQYETFMVRCESAYRRSKEPFAKHFESAYGDTHELPPYWMLVNLMDFGMVLTLFRGRAGRRAQQDSGHARSQRQGGRILARGAQHCEELLCPP